MAEDLTKELTPEETLEARSAQADYAVSSWIARQVASWAAEYANANPGHGLMVGDVSKPILAGSTAALMRFAWESAAADATAAMVADQFRDMAMMLLTPIALASKPGGMASMMQGDKPN